MRTCRWRWVFYTASICVLAALLALPQAALAEQLYIPVELPDGETAYRLISVPEQGGSAVESIEDETSLMESSDEPTFVRVYINFGSDFSDDAQTGTELGASISYSLKRSLNSFCNVGATKHSTKTDADWRLLGWYRDADLTDEIKFDGTQVISQDDVSTNESGELYITIYAKWEEASNPASATHCVRFWQYAQNGYSYEEKIVADGQTVKAPVLSSYESSAYEEYWADENGDEFNASEGITCDRDFSVSGRLKEGYGYLGLNYGDASEYGSTLDSSFGLKIGNSITSLIESGYSSAFPCEVGGYYTNSKGTFKLLGWYKDSGFTDPVDFDAATAASDFSQSPYSGSEANYYIIYAEWEEIEDLSTVTYTVTFEWYSEAGEQTQTQTVHHGDTVSKPSDPDVYSHYVFKAWMYQGEEYDFDTPVTKSMTLYAGTALKEGYGWLCAWGTNELYLIDTTGDIASSVSRAMNHYAEEGDARATEDGGYEQFVGWYRDADLTTELDPNSLTAADFIVDETNDGNPTLYIYGKWEPVGDISKITYSVTFTWYNDNGAQTQTQTVKLGDKATKPSDPEVYSYEVFKAWMCQGEEYDFDSPVLKNIELYADTVLADGYAWLVALDSIPGSGFDGSYSWYPVDLKSDSTYENLCHLSLGDIMQASGSYYKLVGCYSDAAHTKTFDLSQKIDASLFAEGNFEYNPEEKTFVIYCVYEATDAPSSPFTDVVSGDESNHATEVLWMAERGISEGWTEADGTKTFRGMQEVKRCDLAAFLFRMAKADGLVSDDWQPSGSSTFADVSDKTDHYREVMWLAESGISRGWDVAGGKEFRPYATVARQDVAAFLYRYAEAYDKLYDTSWAQTQGPEALSFEDVVDGDTGNHANEVKWLASWGVTKGWQVGENAYEFRGLQTVKRQDLAAFLYRLDNNVLSTGENA